MGARRGIEIAGLDGLRVMAAALVMAHHFLFADRLRPGASMYDAAPAPGGAGTSFAFGWIGVEVFFVVSGFVIAYSAAQRSPLSFLRSRLLRLAPGVWICATAELAVLWFCTGRPHPALASQWLRTVAFSPYDPIDGVYWTLSIEIYFYALVALMLGLGLRRFIEPAMAALGLCSGLMWLTALSTAGGLHDLIAAKEDGGLLRCLMLTHGSFFALGICLFRGFSDGFGRWRTAAVALMLACCALEIVHHDRTLAARLATAMPAWPALLVFAAAVAAICASVRFNAGLLRRLGPEGLRVARALGRSTYPLYLVHPAAGVLVAALLGPGLGFAAIPCAMAAALLGAALIERFPERWLRARLAAMLPPRLALDGPPPTIEPRLSQLTIQVERAA